DDVAGLYGRAAAGDGEIVVPGHVPPSKNCGVGAFGVDGQADGGDLLVVAHSPVGDDPGGAVVARADREDVPQGAGFHDATGLDDDDLTFLHRVERPLLGVVAAAVGCEQVLAIGNETQRLRGADDLAGTRLRLDAVDVDVVESALAEHLRERRHWALLELRAKFGGQARRGRFDTRG